MLDVALITSAALMGLAGTPHCALMCSAPCALAARGAQQQTRLLIGRVLGYAAGGALAAASAQVLGELSQGAAVLKPAWAMLQAAVLLLGLSLLVRGRAPGWLGAVRWQPKPRHAFGTGLAWVVMPCGLLHAALLLSALSSSPLSGAAAMAAFAVTSTLGLVVAPALRSRLPQRAGDATTALRLAGLGMAVASGWALGHGIWQQVLLVC